MLLIILMLLVRFEKKDCGSLWGTFHLLNITCVLLLNNLYIFASVQFVYFVFFNTFKCLINV